MPLKQYKAFLYFLYINTIHTFIKSYKYLLSLLLAFSYSLQSTGLFYRQPSRASDSKGKSRACE